MTQLVSISASTAALNIENLRLPRRVSIKDQVADTKSDADRNARRAENAGDPEASEMMVPPPAVGLDFLASGEQPRQQQINLHDVDAAYRDLD